MHVVINISDELYSAINKDTYEVHRGRIYDIIRNGSALPKGHGRLIDARGYENNIRKHYFDNSTVIRCTEIALDNAPTIIKADKESEEENG